MMGGVPGAALRDTICRSAWALLPRACLGAQGWRLGVHWEDAPVCRGTGGEPHTPSSVHSTLLVPQATSWHGIQRGWPWRCHSPPAQQDGHGLQHSSTPRYGCAMAWPGAVTPCHPAALPHSPARGPQRCHPAALAPRPEPAQTSHAPAGWSPCT